MRKEKRCHELVDHTHLASCSWRRYRDPEQWHWWGEQPTSWWQTSPHSRVWPQPERPTCCSIWSWDATLQHQSAQVTKQQPTNMFRLLVITVWVLKWLHWGNPLHIQGIWCRICRQLFVNTLIKAGPAPSSSTCARDQRGKQTPALHRSDSEKIVI